MRVCKKCEEEKPLEDFPDYKMPVKGKDPVIRQRHTCRTCFNRGVVEWFDENPTAKVRSHIKRTYGLDFDEYRDLMKNGCEVCGTFEGLCVDHDHSCCPEKGYSCGKCIRGALCRAHNLAEGYCHSDPEEAMRLVEYMVRTSRRRS